MSTTYGEREGKLNLSTAWEILGGRPCSGICGYIADAASLEMNDEYTTLIEKKAENMYRTINQKLISFPASNQAVKQMVSVSQNTDLTPQASEQLSQYAADDQYVQQQKEDILELASMFRGMMGKEKSSIEAFAEKLDITPKFCADIELGNKGMSVQTLCNISSILKVSTDYILFGTSQQDCSLSSMMLQHCTPEEQRYAEEILKTFIMAMNNKHE